MSNLGKEQKSITPIDTEALRPWFWLWFKGMLINEEVIWLYRVFDFIATLRIQ
jgi:hypothetical protein